MLEGINSINKFGDKLVISGTNDTYLYSQGEYFSIEAGNYEAILVSNDTNICVSLLKGTVYVKNNVGFHMVKKKIDGILDYNQVSVCNDKLMCHQTNRLTSQGNVIFKNLAQNVTHRFRKPQGLWGQGYLLVSNTHLLYIDNENPTVHPLSNPDISYEILKCRSLEVRTLPSIISDSNLYTRVDNDYRAIFESVNEEVICCGTYKDSETEVHRFGFHPSEYPRSGNHWIIAHQNADDTWKVHPFPKLQEAISLGEGHHSWFSKIFFYDRFSTIKSEYDFDTYYCASTGKVYKVSTNDTQETIATINLDRNCRDYSNYTVNYGSKIKYEPDFIITKGHPTTITILPPQEAETLQQIQNELIKNSNDDNIVSEIDGRFLLSAAVDSKNEHVFAKHGIDIDRFKKD